MILAWTVRSIDHRTIFGSRTSIRTIHITIGIVRWNDIDRQHQRLRIKIRDADYSHTFQGKEEISSEVDVKT